MAFKTKPYVKDSTLFTMEDVNAEFNRLADALESLALHIFTEKTYIKPDKPVELQLVYADGTKWNPGQGAGIYVFINNAWKKVTIT